MQARVRGWFTAQFALIVIAAAVPAQAQRDYEPLFDKFGLRIEGSWVALNTEIRLDSELLGTGTALNFEDDLNLDGNKLIPTVAFEWQMGRRHRLGLRWQDISRKSSAQALTEIRWGEEIIPIDANINLGFDITQGFLDYTYFPWVKDRWAAGFGLGIRLMEVDASLRWEEQSIGDGGDSATGTGPLPYIYFEYRRLFSDNWRFNAGFGWLYVEIDDIKGGQLVGRASIEYLLGRTWGFGAALNLSTIDVDWKGLENDEGQSVLSAAVQVDVNDFSVFVRLRF
jgi:hypothetical protein